MQFGGAVQWPSKATSVDDFSQIMSIFGAKWGPFGGHFLKWFWKPHFSDFGANLGQLAPQLGAKIHPKSLQEPPKIHPKSHLIFDHFLHRFLIDCWLICLTDLLYSVSVFLAFKGPDWKPFWDAFVMGCM